MNIFPIDHHLLTILKFFVVFTCFAYWVRRIVRSAIRSQQPRFYRDHAR